MSSRTKPSKTSEYGMGMTILPRWNSYNSRTPGTFFSVMFPAANRLKKKSKMNIFEAVDFGASRSTPPPQNGTSVTARLPMDFHVPHPKQWTTGEWRSKKESPRPLILAPWDHTSQSGAPNTARLLVFPELIELLCSRVLKVKATSISCRFQEKFATRFTRFSSSNPSLYNPTVPQSLGATFHRATMIYHISWYRRT